MLEAALKVTPKGEVLETCPLSQEAGPAVPTSRGKEQPIGCHQPGKKGDSELWVQQKRQGCFWRPHSGRLRVKEGGCSWGLECLASSMAAEARQGRRISMLSGQQNWCLRLH